jgi:putative membrane protein
MLERIQPFLKMLLLVTLGVFLYSRIANGTLYYYINERFASFTVIGVVGLLLLGFSYRWEKPAAADGAAEPNHTHDHHDHGQHGHDQHEHGHSHALSWTGALIIALPILLGLATTPQPLGAAALANRDVTLSMNESALPVGLRTREKAAIDKNMMDWWHDFRSSATTGQELIGQEVRVSGFIFRDEKFGAEHFLVTRFIVSCCVADANVLGLLVRIPDEMAPAIAALDDDQWVEVQGTFVAGAVEGWHMPVVQVQQVTPIDVPAQPYLYP